MAEEMAEGNKTDRRTFLDTLLTQIGIVIIWLITIFVFIGVILRYIFNMYVPVFNEVPTQGMKYNRPTKRVMDAVFTLGGLAAGIIWLWGSVQLFLSDITDRGVTLEMRIPWFYYHIFQVIGLALFTIYMVVEVMKVFSHSSGRGHEEK
jgi:TRAP-type C4-dicarboxylate transport system permease small subunit